MSNDMLKSMTRKYCVNGANFSLPDTRPSWFTAQLDELIKSHNREARFLQMPSFAGANAIGVFSDYAGTHKQARVQTYSFLFVDFGALGTFDEKVKEIRRRANLPLTREIAFKELRSGSVVSALPHLLRAADQLPGLLFTLVVDKDVPSIISSDPNTHKFIRAQLNALGFHSWRSDEEAERLGRVLHSVCYWLSMLGRDDMKTLWMTDNDSILGRSDYPEEFRSAYAQAMGLFNPPDFSILGTATSFEVATQQPYLHEAVSIADLVAGAMCAYFSDVEGENFHEKRYPAIGEILTFLMHQSVFLKKLTFVARRMPNNTVGFGLASVERTACSIEGYTSVSFD